MVVLMRRSIIAGNWKMYKDTGQTRTFFENFLPLIEGPKGCEVVVFPPFVNVQVAANLTANTDVEIGGQNLFWAKEGAYTGEISGEMLKSAGCRWVLIAHSERRQYFGETDETANRKTVAALGAGLTPIVCVGEVLGERESGQTKVVLERQFTDGIAPLSPEQFGKIVIAYEPVWAIGTGKTATPAIAEDAHRAIRNLVRKQYGDEAAEKCRILYGGSVKPDNVRDLMSRPDIDGALVGGASLDPVGFAAIVNYETSKLQ